jgi:hypothetical protein
MLARQSFDEHGLLVGPWCPVQYSQEWFMKFVGHRKSFGHTNNLSSVILVVEGKQLVFLRLIIQPLDCDLYTNSSGVFYLQLKEDSSYSLGSESRISEDRLYAIASSIPSNELTNYSE